MGEILSSITEAMRNRATSTALVTYTAFWIGWHWQGIFTALFVSEEKIFLKFKMLKNEYLNQYFFGWHGWETFWGFAVPLVLTVMFIWPFQKYVHIHAYKLEQRSKTSRKKIKHLEEIGIEKFKAELLIKESKKVEAETIKVEAETKLSESRKKAAKSDPKILWDRDYEAFKKTIYHQKFGDIRDAVYTHNGRYHLNSFEHGIDFNIESGLLAYADTEELISIDQGLETITLTQKGKHFLKKYQSEMIELPF